MSNKTIKKISKPNSTKNLMKPNPSKIDYIFPQKYSKIPVPLLCPPKINLNFQ